MIQLNDINFSYGKAAVLQNIDAQFHPGTLTGIVGPNGSGKTTLLRLLARLLTPTAGTILLHGQPYAVYDRREFARQVALLPQSRPLPAMSVQELVSHGRYPYLDLSRRLRPADHDAVLHAMQQTGADTFAGRELPTLSGGERQRAYLAMLLAQDTECILLDEPTTYLDLAAQFRTMQTLQALRDSGHCVIVVLHDLSLALRFCDELLVLENGCKRAQGSSHTLVASGMLDQIFGIVCTPVEIDGKTEYMVRAK